MSHSATAELQSCRINGRCLCCAACCHPVVANASLDQGGNKVTKAPMGVEIVDPSSPECSIASSSVDSQRTVSPFVGGDGDHQQVATNSDIYKNNGPLGRHHHKRQMSVRMFGKFFKLFYLFVQTTFCYSWKRP